MNNIRAHVRFFLPVHKQRLIVCLLASMFSLQACQQLSSKPATVMISQREIEDLVDVLTSKVRWENQQDARKALMAAVIALTKDSESLLDQDKMKLALNALASGQTTAAKMLLANRADHSVADHLQSAMWRRHVAALAAITSAQEAIAAYRQATQLDPNDTDSWDHLGHLLNNTESPVEAAKAFSQQLALAEKSADRKLQSLAYSNLAEAYQTQREFIKAVEYLHNALKINAVLGDKASLAKNYHDLGVAYFNQRDAITQAIEQFQQALKLYTDLGNWAEVAQQYDHLGDAYQKRGDFPQTIAFYQQALQGYEKLADKPKIALNYRNLGIIYKIHQDLDKALPMLQTALQLDEQIGDKNGIAFDCNYLGLIYQLQGNKTEARRYFTRSIEYYRLIDSDEAEPVQDLLDQL